MPSAIVADGVQGLHGVYRENRTAVSEVVGTVPTRTHVCVAHQACEGEGKFAVE